MYVGKTEDGSHLLVSVNRPSLRLSMLVLFQRSAQYLRTDLPIRFAHRIDDFRNLPFVVACNPLLLELVRTNTQSPPLTLLSILVQHERFIKIFHTLHSFPPVSDRYRVRRTRSITLPLKIKTLDQEKAFTELLQNTLNCSSDTLPLLAEGFRESKRHIKVRPLFAAHTSSTALFALSIIVARNARTKFSRSRAHISIGHQNAD